MSPELRERGPWWWLSFAGTEGFRGACVVGGVHDIVSAVRVAHALGINPGGEVLAVEIPERGLGTVEDGEIERLLTKQEAEAIGARHPDDDVDAG